MIFVTIVLGMDVTQTSPCYFGYSDYINIELEAETNKFGKDLAFGEVNKVKVRNEGVCFTLAVLLPSTMYSQQTVVVETSVFALVTLMLSLHVPPGSSALRSPTKFCRALASLTHRASCLEKNSVLVEVSS